MSFWKGNRHKHRWEGFFSFPGDSGKIEITFKYIGYKPVTETIRLEADKTVRLDV